ncbi:hypothetical protein H5410_036984 [Solanum commersonii]|uniref:Uncharacterized protein n=1 Tax=Solanum commersonii TaxID=4109 RepID=A0A9J5Y876_SOLCO|nr:hypothetical protein H5410_036984 [Solanum commersonii]
MSQGTKRQDIVSPLRCKRNSLRKMRKALCSIYALIKWIEMDSPRQQRSGSNKIKRKDIWKST